MARARQQRHLDRAIAFLLRDLDLLHRAVLVVLALHDQDGHADIGEELGDIPFAEFGIEPGAVPALEGVVDVGMPARKPRPQIAGLIGFARLLDRGDAHVLGEEMWRHQHQAADAMILMAAGIDRRDGRAVAVTDQKPALETDRIEQARQRLARLVVHIGERPRQLHRRRLAVAGTRIGEHAATGRFLQAIGEITPQTDAAQTFMQHDDRRRRIRPRANHAVFEILGTNIEEAGI